MRMYMELLLGSLLPLLPATFAAVGDEPSFLFILGDDIGWQDFSYNNGTAASPFINVSIYHLFLFFFFFFQKVLSADTDGTNPRTYAHKRDTNTQWLQGSLLSDTDAQTLADIACIRSTHAKPLILGLVLFPILFPASCFLLPASCFCVRVQAWTKADGTITMQDFHTGGTVCSPTRATVLTGRNHFRDCVQYVYGCSDMTECVPSFEFAPQGTFTIGDAARAANKNYSSHFGGKW